ncbi:MAG: GatB/YqeY domain-containing protein [Candidatus Pacebacteria bacterium]|nr:GatB/YqeY domain-containing protein [Candidatus Paceibacterota bacterium]
MTLQEQIKEEMKTSMRARDMQAVTTYRGLMSAFTNEVVAQKLSPDTPVTDEMALTVITREAKRRKDSIKQFSDAGRDDLADDEKKELAMLEKFLPTLMSVEEITKIVSAKKEEMGITDLSEKGKFIGAVMGELKGKADGALVKEVVDGLFA